METIKETISKWKLSWKHGTSAPNIRGTLLNALKMEISIQTKKNGNYRGDYFKMGTLMKL